MTHICFFLAILILAAGIYGGTDGQQHHGHPDGAFQRPHRRDPGKSSVDMPAQPLNTLIELTLTYSPGHTDCAWQHLPGSAAWYVTTAKDLVNARPKGSGHYVDVAEVAGTSHEIRAGQTRWISFNEVNRSSPELHIITKNIGVPTSQLQIEKSRSGGTSGFANCCISSITENGAELLKSRQVPCIGAENNVVMMRIWATLDKLVPKQVEFGTDTVLDPAFARTLFVQYAVEKDIWLTPSQDIAYGDPQQQGAVPFAKILGDNTRIRIGPRRLVGIVDAISTHSEENKDGKVVAVTNPKFTVYTNKRVEVRCSTWKLLEATEQVLKGVADLRTSDPSLGPHMAHMVPFGSDAIDAYRRGETCAKIDFGTMQGITLAAVYDLTVGVAQVLHVSIQTVQDKKDGVVVLTRTIAKVTAADKEGQVRLCSLDGMLYASLGSVSQVLRVAHWQSNELALVPADLREFTVTKSGLCRLGDQLTEVNPLQMLREMDAEHLRIAYVPHAELKAQRVTELHNDIAAIAERKLAESHGLAFRMPIGQCTLVMIRDPQNQMLDISYTETVFHGQTVWNFAYTGVANNIDEDDEEWVTMAASQNGGQVPQECNPAPQTLFRQRGSQTIPLKSAILTEMRDYMARIDQTNGPQVLYIMIDFTGKTLKLVESKTIKLQMGPSNPSNTTAEAPDAKKSCTSAAVIEEHLKSGLQRGAVITCAFPPEIKSQLRALVTGTMDASSSVTVVDVMEFLENDPADPADKHPTLSMYDTAIVCTALEMAIAAPFDRSGGTDMYDSVTRVAILNRMDTKALMDRTRIVFEYFSTYSNALTIMGPPTPAGISLNLSGSSGGTAATVTACVPRTRRTGPQGCRYGHFSPAYIWVQPSRPSLLARTDHDPDAPGPHGHGLRTLTAETARDKQPFYKLGNVPTTWTSVVPPPHLFSLIGKEPLVLTVLSCQLKPVDGSLRNSFLMNRTHDHKYITNQMNPLPEKPPHFTECIRHSPITHTNVEATPLLLVISKTDSNTARARGTAATHLEPQPRHTADDQRHDGPLTPNHREHKVTTEPSWSLNKTIQHRTSILITLKYETNRNPANHPTPSLQPRTRHNTTKNAHTNALQIEINAPKWILMVQPLRKAKLFRSSSQLANITHQPQTPGQFKFTWTDPSELAKNEKRIRLISVYLQHTQHLGTTITRKTHAIMKTVINTTATSTWRILKATWGLVTAFKNTIMTASAALSPVPTTALPMALLILAIISWRSGGVIRTLTQSLQRHTSGAAKTLTKSRKHLSLMVLLMIFATAQADTSIPYESAFHSITLASLPAACATSEMHDCAGQWVKAMGDTDWEDLKHTHEDEEYWEHMGWDKEYYGDSMEARGGSTGLRIIAQNAGRRLFKKEQASTQVSKLQLLLAHMATDSVDIAILHEPGLYRKTEDNISRELGDAWRHLVVRRDPADEGGGVLIIFKATIEPAINEAMRRSITLQTQSNVRSQNGQRYEADRLVTLELSNPRLHTPTRGQQERKDRLLMVLVYGHNTTSPTSTHASQWGHNEQAQRDLMSDARKAVNEFRGRHPKASVILAGDLNSAEYTQLDSLEKGTDPASLGRPNQDADMRKKLPGHSMMSTLRDMGLHDTFREHHPYTKAVTRWPQGEQAGSPRRLDSIWTTKELAEAITTRVGIKAEDDILNSDHRMNYVDVPLDIANLATNRQITWSKTKETKITPLSGLNKTHPKVLEFQDKLKNWEPEPHLHDVVTRQAADPTTTEAEWDTLMNSEFNMLNRELYKAGDGTILTTTKITSPNFISKVPDMTAADWKHFLRRRRLRAAIEALTRNLDSDETNRRMDRIPEPTTITNKKGETLPQYSNASLEKALTTNKRAARGMMIKDVKTLNTWLDAEDRKLRNTTSRQHREAARLDFSHGKVRKTVRAVFTKHKALKAKVWLADSTGALINGTDAITEYVGSFLRDWMSTKAPLTSRFKDIEAVLNWDLSEMTPQHRESVETFYSAGGKDRHYYADKEDLWEGTLSPVTDEELQSAISSFSTGKATGPSQTSIEVFKWMTPNLKTRVKQFLTECIRKRRFPQHANAAKMWLVPKNEAGATDLSQTRPIALMETMCKLYERVLCDRILEVMMKNNMIDRCQHGSIPEGTTTDAMFNLAGVMDDARASKQSLYLLSLDLSKAFDTLEYWSQAMTWRAFGMPKDLVRILLQMDQTATTQVAIGGGRYTNPIPHGRGVRQGSCGGPLKWIAFMHWWMVGTKAKMQGNGYKMSADPSTEFIAQMFVDDSNWATSSSGAMQDMVSLHEGWVSLHALGINKKKTDLLTVNPEQDEHYITWRDGTPLTSVDDDNPVRYLGAHFQTDGGWEGEAEILQTKLKERLTPVSTKAKSHLIPQIRYLLNGVILPALLHPLKVACLSPKTINSMDSQIRKTFYDAAAMSSNDTPSEVTHLPVQLGGWGIHSVEMQAHSQCVSTWMKAMNQDTNHMTRRIADALIKSYKIRNKIAGNPLTVDGLKRTADGSQLENLRRALTTLDLSILTSDITLCNPENTMPCFQKKPTLIGQQQAAEEDIGQASEVEKRGHVNAFTDGSLEDPTRKSPKCGWGYHLTWGTRNEYKQGHGRVMSVPTIFEAESEAVLRALMAVHPEDSIEIFIDNMSVLDQLNSEIKTPWQDSTAQTLNSPARATWMRIRSILKHRLALNSQTAAAWVHSHVDQKERLEVKCTTHTCACHRGELQGTSQCTPSSWAHKGNDEADKAADRGAHYAAPPEQWTGEIRVFPAPTGEHITGEKLKDVLEKAIHTTLFNKAISKDKTRATRLQDRNQQTDKGMRTRLSLRAVTGWKGVNERFAVRAAMDILPTYKRLAKAVHSNTDNKTRKQYTPEDQEDPIIDTLGTCILCGQAPESIAHILLECQHCPQMQLLRQNRLNCAAIIAHNHNLEDWWQNNDWTRPALGWDPQWGALGQAPNDSWETITLAGADEQAATKCMGELQDNMIISAHALWTRRNELVLEKEKSLGVTDTKKEYENYKTQAKPGAHGSTRGRPPLALEQMAKSSRDARLRLEDKRALDLIQPDSGPDRDTMQRELKKARLADARRADQGTLGHLGAPGEGADPVTKGLHNQRSHTDKHTEKADTLGIGSRIQIRWPNEKGRSATKWRGTVVALTPNSNGTMDQIVRYDQYPEDHYRHALWAGLTPYGAIEDGACPPNCNHTCQQGRDECKCEAHLEPHRHPWYQTDTNNKDTCNCMACTMGDPECQRLIDTAKDCGADLPAGKKYHRGPRNLPTPHRPRKEKPSNTNTPNSEGNNGATSTAESNRQRDERRAKRARGARGGDRGSDTQNAPHGTHQEAPAHQGLGLQRSLERTGQDGEIRGTDDHGPNTWWQEHMGNFWGSPTGPAASSAFQGCEMDQPTHQGRPQGHSSPGQGPVQEAAPQLGGKPDRPDRDDQSAHERDGDGRGADPRPRGEGDAQPVLRRPECGRPGEGNRTEADACGHPGKLRPEPARRARAQGPYTRQHRPPPSSEKGNGTMGSEARGTESQPPDLSSWRDPVPHLDTTGRDPQTLRPQLPAQVRQTESQAPKEGAGSSRAVLPRREHSGISFRMDLPGSLYGNPEILLVREWSMGSSWRPALHASPPRPTSRQLLQIPSPPALRRDVPIAEGHQHLDEPPGMGAQALQPHGVPPGSDWRRLIEEAQASRHVHLGNQALDSRRPPMGPARNPQTQAPSGLARIVKKRRTKNKIPLTPEEASELMCRAREKRQESTRIQNEISEAASQTHGLQSEPLPGGGEGRGVGLGLDVIHDMDI